MDGVLGQPPQDLEQKRELAEPYMARGNTAADYVERLTDLIAFAEEDEPTTDDDST